MTLIAFLYRDRECYDVSRISHSSFEKESYDVSFISRSK